MSMRSEMAGTEMPYQTWVNRFDIREGDTLLVVSEVLAIAAQCAARGGMFEPGLFLESIEKKLGKSGTLLLPAFHFGFCDGQRYDILKTLPVTGALPRCALKRAGYSRTRHPMHSFVVWGARRQELCQLRNVSSFGGDSPLGFLHQNAGKMWIMGRSYRNSFTFVHYVEEREKAPYRYLKSFTAPYTDESGMTQTRTYKMFVRRLEQGEGDDRTE